MGYAAVHIIPNRDGADAGALQVPVRRDREGCQIGGVPQLKVGVACARRAGNEAIIRGGSAPVITVHAWIQDCNKRISGPTDGDGSTLGIFPIHFHHVLHVLCVIAIAENQGDIHFIAKRRRRRNWWCVDGSRNAAEYRAIAIIIAGDHWNPVIRNPGQAVGLAGPPTHVNAIHGAHVGEE